MPLIDQKIVVGAKVETTQGAAVALASTDYMLAETDSFIDADMDEVARNPRRGSLDETSHLIGKRWYDGMIHTEIKGSGVAGTPYAPFGALMQASGYIETATTNGVTGVPVTAGGSGYATSFPVTFTGGAGSGALAWAYAPAGVLTQIIVVFPGTGYTTAPTAVITAGGGAGGTVGVVTTGSSVWYAPTSNPATNFFTPSKSATIEVYSDGNRQSAVGSVCDLAEIYEYQKVAYATFKFKSKYTALSPSTTPATSYLAQVPALLDQANFRCQDFIPVATKLAVNTNNTIAERGDMNAAGGILGFMQTDRKPNGSFDPEMELASTHDFYGKAISAVEGLTCLKLGSVAGNTVWSICPKTQYKKPKRGNRNGIQTLDMPLQFNGYLGDDWHSIVMF